MSETMHAATPAPERGATRLGLRDRVLEWRNRLLASQRFQRWAASFPLTRRVSAHHARRLFDIGAGFVYAQIHLACVQTRIFDHLADGPLTIDALAPRLGLPRAGAERLVKAAAALDLLEARGEGRYGLGMLGAAFRGNPGLGRMIEHHRLLYADLRDPVALLRGEVRDPALERFWRYAGAEGTTRAGAEEVAPYSALMSETLGMIADDVLEVANLDRAGTLMDVGCGEGGFLTAAGRHAPHLHLVGVDVPEVAARAAEQLTRAGLANRARTVGVDFRSDPLPTGANVISLVRILHDHDDDTVRTLLRAVRAALPRAGRVIVAEPMSGIPGAEPIGDAYFGFYLLAMGQGRPRTIAENVAFLTEAGFVDARPLRTRRPLLCAAIQASTTT